VGNSEEKSISSDTKPSAQTPAGMTVLAAFVTTTVVMRASPVSALTRQQLETMSVAMAAMSFINLYAHSFTSSDTRQGENKKIDVPWADPRAGPPNQAGSSSRAKAQWRCPTTKNSHTLGVRKPLLDRCRRPAARTTPRPLPHWGCGKNRRKSTRRFDMEFQQDCARIVQFAMPHDVDGTGNCHNQTASHHLSGRMLTGQPRRCTEAHGDGD
jgi:hypothetical protein